MHGGYRDVAGNWRRRRFTNGRISGSSSDCHGDDHARLCSVKITRGSGHHTIIKD